MLTASSSYAGQVELSVENRIGGESNVLRREDAVDDGTYALAPRLGVRDDQEDVNYAFDYNPIYRAFFKTSGIDGVDHNAHGRLGWAISPRDRIDVKGSYYNGRQFLFATGGGGSSSTFGVNDRERIRISNANLGYRRLLSPQLTFGLSGDFDDFDASGTSTQSQTDSRAYTGRVTTEYALDPLTQVSLIASGRRRENRAVGPFVPSARTDVFDVMGSITRVVTPTITVTVQVGPSFIRQQQVPGGAIDLTTGQRFEKDESNDVTVFAFASANKEWRTSTLAASYVRSESRSGTVSSSSSIQDRVDVNFRHQFNDSWTLRMNGAWDRLDQIFNQEGPGGKFTLTSIRTTETVEFTLSRHVQLIGQYTFVNQDNDYGSQAGASTDVDLHIGFFALRYTFEPLAY